MTRWAGYGTKTAATPCGCPAPKWASRSAPRCRAWPLPSWVCRLRRCTCNYPAPATSPACAPLWAAPACRTLPCPWPAPAPRCARPWRKARPQVRWPRVTSRPMRCAACSRAPGRPKKLRWRRASCTPSSPASRCLRATRARPACSMAACGAHRWRPQQPRSRPGGRRVERASIGGPIYIDTHLRRGALQRRLRKDDLPTDTAWTVDLRMDVPLAAHAPIEPRSATAHWLADAGKEGIALKVGAGTQDLFYMRDVLARQFSLHAKRIEVRACRIGGGFGGRTLCTVELEAAVLAQVVGAPVKVQWSRAQEFAQGFQRPPSSHRVRARVHGGRITHWWHALASSHILFTPAAMPVWMQTLA